MKTLLIILLTATFAFANPTDFKLVGAEEVFKATHELIFITTQNTLTVAWCISETWRCEVVEIRGWEYSRDKYYSLPDLDGDPGNHSMQYKIPKAGLWRIETRYKDLSGNWSSWNNSTHPNNNTAECGPDGVSPDGWWLYVELGKVTGGGIGPAPTRSGGIDR